MIKILFFIESLGGGGAEKVLCNLVNNMDLSRFDVTVQTLFPDTQAANLKAGIHYKTLYKKKDKVAKMLCRIEAVIGLSYPLRMKGKYDIEVAYLECGSTKILAGSTNKKAKKIAWVHCDLVRAFGDEARGFAEKTEKWYRKYDKVACVSKQVETSFHELFGDDIETKVIYNTVDSEEIIRKSNLAIEADLSKKSKAVLFVGRLAYPKNVLRILAAHKRILDEGIDHQIWIVGEGEDRKIIEGFVAEHQIQDSVQLFGFQKNPYPFMKEADVVVCSSDYEGFSTFITEALILGKAIVTTDVSGMRELLGDNEYGVITAVDDEAFYYGLKKVLSYENEEMNCLVEMASKRGTTFNTKNLVSQTEQFFMEVLKERGNDK